ncbi:MAG: aminotransferase class IV [Chloroflexi bacterium]|nr:aminotransferase class IV [Chloroflexota bacterium]
MAEKIYLNGELLPLNRATLSPYDHGFLYGYGLFEVVSVHRGVPFRLDRHLARLRRSAAVLSLAPRLSGLDLEAACLETLRANPREARRDAVMRLTVSGGPADLFPVSSGLRRPTVLITVRAFRPPPVAAYRKGFTAIIAEFRRDSLSPLSRVQTTSYLTNYIARQEAVDTGADEALMENERGLLVDGSSSNIFVVMGKMLLTPPLKDGAVPGITREAILELAPLLGFEGGEWSINAADLLQSREAFLTNSTLGVMPLTGLKGQNVGGGKPGPVTKKLMAAYKKLVKKETS